MRAHRRSGFTLLEILIVITLLALVMGIGAGMFARIDLSDRVARPLVESVLRSAQNWAVARGASATVRIDPKTGALRAEGMRVVGTWHFESLPPAGAFGLEGLAGGGHLVDDGFQGKALSFVGERSRARLEIPVKHDPAFDLGGGFALRCALRVEPGSTSQSIGTGQVLDVGQVLGLEVGEGGSLAAWFVTERLDEHKAPERGGRIVLRSGAGALVPGRWAQVEISYDRHAFEIHVDGARLAGLEESARVWKLEGPLLLSPGQTPFAGAIDSLVVNAVGAAEEALLPQRTHFAADVPREIVFRPGGGLDRERHREAVRVGLENDDGTRSVVTVQPYGTVE